MKLKDANRMIRKNMKKNRSRTLMTVFAVAIGCAFLVVLASFGYGVQKGVIESIAGERLLNQIQIHDRRIVVDGEERWQHQLTAEDVRTLQQIEGVKAVYRSVHVGQPPAVYYESYQGRAFATAVDFNAEAASGRELSAGRMPEKPNEVMVGYYFNGILGEDPEVEPAYAENPAAEELLGSEVELEFRQYFDDEETFKHFTVTIAGIAEKPAREWDRDQRIYISEELLVQIEEFTRTREGHVLEPGTPAEIGEQLALKSSEPRRYQQVYLYTHQVQDVKEVSMQLQESGYLIYSVLNEIDKINFYFLIFKVGLIFVGTIALIIASIGIYNTMTMAVTERSQEIGIMKAVGTHPRAIKNIFLLESTYIGIAGALVGVLVAYVVSTGVNLGLPVLFDLAFNETLPDWFQFSHIPASLAVISFFICVGTAAVSGLRPAAKATQVDVLRALRRDL